MRTLVIRIDPSNPSVEELKRAAEVARRGGLVAFPTETVYGLGTNAFDEGAVKRLFEVKRRPPDNPVSVLVSSVDQAKSLGYVNEMARKLIEEFFPGPITVVMKAKRDVPKIVTAGTGKVAVRMPDHPIALKIVEFAGVPLATPSANVSGRPSPTKAEHVLQDFEGKIDLLVDGGETGIGIESTVVDVTEKPKILRLGAIPVEDIEEVLGEVEVVEAPSMKYAHYKPRSKVVVVFGDSREEVLGRIRELVYELRGRGLKVGVALRRIEDVEADLVLEMGEDVREYAKKVFDVLRRFEEVDVGIVEGIRGRGLAKAVMNRLIKASDEVIDVER